MGWASIHILDELSAILARWGYAGLFVLMFADTAMLLHFLPTLLIITVAVVLLAHTPASLALTIAVMTVGGVAGSFTLYAAMYSGGHAFLARYGRWIGADPARVERLEAAFQKPMGDALVFGLRLVPMLRVLVTVPAGTARMPWRRFLLYTGMGTLLFNASLALLAYESNRPTGRVHSAILDARADLARQSRDFASSMQGHGWILVAALVVAILAAFWAWSPRSARGSRPLRHGWTRGAIVLAGLGVAAGASALLAPAPTYGGLAWLSEDYADAASQAGAGPVLAVMLAASAFLLAGLLGLALGPALRRRNGRSVLGQKRGEAVSEDRERMAQIGRTSGEASGGNERDE